jgi:Phosphotransferase enzyme family
VRPTEPNDTTASHETERPLSGSRVTQGVVRIADTVRRPPTLNSPFVHAVLKHLQTSGFTGAPCSLGSEEAGRDIFSYIEGGEVPKDLGWYDDDVLIEAASLIRGYHDATSNLLAAPSAQTAKLEVVCHNDLSPCNFVFQKGRPTAIIDFDAAAPGPRLHDLGYAAWMWLDLGNDDIDLDRQRHRLKVFSSAYDPHIKLAHVIDAIMRRQIILRHRAEAPNAIWQADHRRQFSASCTGSLPRLRGS